MDNLASALYNLIRDDNEVRVFEMFHASSIAECPRSHYFKRLGITRLSNPGAGKMLRWKAGHLIEEVIRPYLQATYPDLVSNIRLDSEEMDMTGEYDNYSEKEATIFEIKSVHDFAFAYQKKGTSRFHVKGEKPYYNHELQNHCYVKLLREQGKPVEFITYVYITLDGRIATYKTAVSDTLLQEVQTRLNTLNQAWKTKTPPACLCTNEDHPLFKTTMQYCDFRSGTDCCNLNLTIKET